MAWTTPRTWNDELVSAAKWNTEVRDNQRALKDPPSQNYEPNEASNYTSASGNYSDVDTDFNFSLTTTGGDVIVSFIGNLTISAGAANRSGYLDVSVDGTRIINNTGAGSGQYPSVAGAVRPVLFTRLITGLSAGVHTFNLQWKPFDGAMVLTMYAGAGTASYDLHGQFWVRELT